MSTTAKSKVKCLIWDLDETLWEGTLSEGGGHVLCSGVLDTIVELDRRGVLHSIASRNSYDIAIQRLRELGVDEYFLVPQIGWFDKAEMVARIQRDLNIGVDSLAFIDDQLFERDAVRRRFPDVRTYSADQVTEITSLAEFAPEVLTSDSGRRREFYRAALKRHADETEFGGTDKEFLESLKMRFLVREACVEDLGRAEELVVRANQLNSTGVTYSFDDLHAMVESSENIVLVAELEDRYGSYGQIGIAVIEVGAAEWTIMLFLMSCRVMSRGVGSLFLGLIAERAALMGVRLQARFRDTGRNRPMYVTYKLAGFTEASSLDDRTQLMTLSEGFQYSKPAYVEVIEEWSNCE